tara:strand:+ start:11434 stop:12372 length:939 start_codon:yes stop_codon:yes gene_type:complete
MQQTTNTILMVRPTNIRANEQTAINNHYQKEIHDVTLLALQLKAEKEFDVFVEKLRNVGINVIVFEPKDGLDTPDAHFPNNWISFHENGIVGLYPMFAENRRTERREDVLFKLEDEGFLINHIMDYRTAEDQGMFLEGTGALLLDRVNRKAYCALSNRADEELFIEFCEDFEFTPIIFTANQTVDGKREPIYHTNVMMCLGETFAVICLASIDDAKERKNVIKHLKEDGKEIIDITEAQVAKFAGNMLQVKGFDDKPYLIMSQSANNSLTQDQIKRLEKHAKILSSSLSIIEACGGGSARCMMAEVFLPKII